MTRLLAFFLIISSLLVATAKADNGPLPPLKGRVLFLGDSITHDGRYITFVETFFRENSAPREALPDLINLGLPSETLSGQSEPDHPFPRPDVHERLDRALEKVKPDLVVACYGMNDGIYHPFSEERFAAYQDGVKRLIAKVKASGAKLVLMTPPPFDPQPMREAGKLLPEKDGANYSWKTIYQDYDEKVIARYAAWILEQDDREGVDGVIDLHRPINDYVTATRSKDPAFAMSKDGVHIDETGHRILAEVMLGAWGLTEKGKPLEVDTDIYALVNQRQKALHNSWLSHVGHKRPGTKAGPPLAEAQSQAASIDAQLQFPKKEKPTVLFNGRDLSGWNGWDKYWSVEDGVIVGRNGLTEGVPDAVPSSTYLFSEKEYRNFRLLLDVKQTTSPKHSTMHSAVAALGERFDDKGDNNFGFRGPLLMFCHDWGIWDAYRRNRIEPKDQKGAIKLDAEKVGDWNSVEILVIGNRVRFAVNGTMVFDFTDAPENLKASAIGLQLHSNQKPQEYRFRGIVISENPEDRMVTAAP